MSGEGFYTVQARTDHPHQCLNLFDPSLSSMPPRVQMLASVLPTQNVVTFFEHTQVLRQDVVIRTKDRHEFSLPGMSLFVITKTLATLYNTNDMLHEFETKVDLTLNDWRTVFFRTCMGNEVLRKYATHLSTSLATPRRHRRETARTGSRPPWAET